VKGELATKQPARPLRYFFMVPALNEELVIGASGKEVTKLFGHEDIGAAQTGVRIINRHSIMVRLQDIEFFSYARIFQQGRNHLGSVGLGGNGQFTRLSALMSLGATPWTECLTEDLDLGLQLVIKGWRLAFTDKAFVHQQGWSVFPS